MKLEVLFILISFLSIVFNHKLFAQENWQDAELVTSKNGITFFDYRHHRNPTYFVGKNSENRVDSVLVHLFRGKGIAEFRGNLVSIPSTNYPTTQAPYKVDLQLKPLFIAEYGDFRSPVRTQISLGPRLMLSSGGFYGVFQWIFPIQNDFKTRLGLNQRPGEVGLGFSDIIRGKNFFNIFLGTFTNDRYGGHIEYIRTLFNSRVYIGGAAFYTGRFIYDEGKVLRDFVNYFSGNVFILYRLKYPDISIRLLGEKFLRDDQGVTLEVFRQFGNTDVGFSATRSKNGDNAGLFITFPLWPRRFYSNKSLQIRPPHSFRLTYDLRPNTGIAERTRSYNDFFSEIYRFNLHYLNSEMQK